MGRGPARQEPTRNNPARPIADIFVLTGNIGGRGRGQERERPEVSAEGVEGRNRGGGTERGRLGKAARRNRDGVEDNGERNCDVGVGVRAQGPRRLGKQRRRQGGYPRGQTRR